VKIAVLIKDVPDLEALVKVVNGGAALEVEKRRMLSFFDEIAVEAALGFKESAGASTYAVTAGSGTGMDAVRRSLAMGVEQAFLIDDPALAGADALTVARALAAVLRREGCDLVLAGRQSTDDEAGLVGPMVAELLGVPCVTAAVEVAVADGVATCVREVPGGRETVRVTLPAVVTAEKGLALPRVPSMMGTMKAMKAQVPKETLAELGVEALAPLAVAGYRGPGVRQPVTMLKGEAADVAAQLVKLLREQSRVL
jgi:electron transfer flavoprotein beta subunit